jgi:hypothetical protein
MIRSQHNWRATCLACLKEIGMFRRLAHHRFCCEEHESTYMAELERVAIERLHNARISTSVNPVSGGEQALSLIGHSRVAGFGPSPAYRGAMQATCCNSST